MYILGVFSLISMDMFPTNVIDARNWLGLGHVAY
jgi:cell division protein FtsW (lipid II flippase)